MLVVCVCSLLTVAQSGMVDVIGVTKMFDKKVRVRRVCRWC